MENSTALIIEALLSSGLIWYVTDYLKKVHPIFKELAPLVSLTLGVLCGLIIVTWLGGLDIMQGILAGMSLAGVTSSVYAQKKKLKNL